MVEFEALVRLASTLFYRQRHFGKQCSHVENSSHETFDFDAHFELQQAMPECIKVIDQLFGRFAHVFLVLLGKEICRDAGVDFSINDLLW